ncbi:hypothetical protein ACL1CX_02095 [Corynebacterium striatum]
MRNIKDSSTREFVVPAGGGSLGSLLAASLDYEPVVVTRLQELIDSAGDAAERLSGAALSSAEKADSSAKAARRFEDAASKYAAAAKVSQDAAKGSEDVAAQSASAADVSAKAAKASEGAAASSASAAKTSQSAAESALSGAKSAQAAAASSAGNAEKSAGAAKAAQARSEEIASSTSWEGDKLTVNGKTSPSLRGPKGDKGETGSVENVSWDDISDKPDFASTWEQVKDKPAAFPPEAHTHTTAQVTGLDAALAGKADKGHKHKVEDVDGLKERLDGQDRDVSGVSASLRETRSQLAGKADESYVKSQIASTRSYVDRAVADGSKIKVVSSMPSYPDSSTVYIVV